MILSTQIIFLPLFIPARVQQAFIQQAKHAFKHLRNLIETTTDMEDMEDKTFIRYLIWKTS